MNEIDNYYRTDSGLTRFKFEAIAAVTKTDDMFVEVHLCSGTIFTIQTRTVPFLEWYDYMAGVQ
tara:strand:- start:1212 stop:1403 length:192 start_codon:yes stop_codon:yes gene_type:complete